MQKNIFLVVTAWLTIYSCSQKETADLIVKNALVYTVDENFSTAAAFAVKDGYFIAIGSDEEVLSQFQADSIIDLDQQVVVPGLIDAHCHFLQLGMNQQEVDLRGTKSYEEVVQRVIDFQNKNKFSHIKGRAWDQNDWEDQSYPDKKLLDQLFPNTPVALTRVDGHAVLCNQAALDLAGITAETKIEGGEILLQDGEPTGVLIDNAEEAVNKAWPKKSRSEVVNALMEAQEICFSHGLTTVDDAGLSREAIEIIDSLNQTGDLNMRIYAMVSYSEDNLDHFLEKGIYKTPKLNVCSFKFYCDGALGSRGAILREPYSDKPGHYGLLVNDIQTLNKTAERLADSEFQMNTHAIGDSANHAVLSAYKKVLDGKPGRRWRVEHAQVISREDFELFDDIVPSIQPTHATSDMYWAEDRLGPERVKGAYAFKDLLDVYGKVSLGTDFPVELVNPFHTFYASVARQDLEQYPEGGFQVENALSREETLRGMTIWAAYSNFEEDEKGSIEVGKFADFVILDRDIMTVPIDQVPETRVIKTYLGGEARN